MIVYLRRLAGLTSFDLELVAVPLLGDRAAGNLRVQRHDAHGRSDEVHPEGDDDEPAGDHDREDLADASSMRGVQRG